MSRKKSEEALYPLREAIKAGDVEGVRNQIAAGVDVNGVCCTKGSRLLHWVTWKNAKSPEALQMCEILIGAGANIMACDDGGNTPLHKAASSGATELCRAYLDRGVDVDILSTYQITPLHGAARYGDIETLQLLIARGADIQAIDHVGDTPLHCAKTSAEKVAWLLAHGANPHVENSYGWTPLHGAGNKRDAKACALLVAAGLSSSHVPANPKDGYLTPFQFAVNTGETAVVQYFLEECGEDPAQRTLKGRTMAQLAGSYEEVKVLMRSFKLAAGVTQAVDGASAAQGLGEQSISKKKGMQPL